MQGGPRPFTLIVEDDVASRDVLQDVLQRSGHAVTVAASGEEAIRLLLSSSELPSAVVVDLVLPVMDGLQFHEWFRQQRKYAQVPVVLVAESEPALDRFAAPRPTVLRKPLRPEAVREALTRKAAAAPPSGSAPSGSGAIARPAASPPSPGPRVLVVDDDTDLRELTRDVLEEDGLAVSVARDGREAMEILGREPIALVLLDLKMPHVDGWDVFVWLRGQPRLKDMPVVILSGSTAPQRATQETLNRDLPFWVKKPVRPRDLLKLVRQHLALAPRRGS